MAMNPSGNQHSDITLETSEVLQRLEDAQTSYDIFKILKEYIPSFRLDFFIIFLSNKDGATALDDRVVLTNWDSEVIHRCMEADYYHWSFVSELRASVLPRCAALSEVADGGTNNAELAQFMLERGHDAFVHLPTRGMGDQTGVVSFSGRREMVTIGETMNLNFVAEHAFERLVSILGNDGARENPLSDREIECLKAAARGLSVQETSKLIAITTHTVNYHLANAQKKLDARNKVQSVALAIQRGWLGRF